MFGFGKKKEDAPVERAASTTAILGMNTQPLLINPDADEDTKQKLYRRDAIQRYTTQRAEEKRPIPPAKMQELEDEYTILSIELRKRGAI